MRAAIACRRWPVQTARMSEPSQRGSRASAPKELRPSARTQPRGWIGRGWRFFARDVWEKKRAGTRGWRGAAFKLARVAYLATRGFLQDKCLSRASALTYITVLSLVPLLAFSFSVAKGFGFYDTLIHDTIDPFLDRTFGPLDSGLSMDGRGPLAAPAENMHEMRTAIARVLDFVNRTEVSALGALGLALLVFTVLKLLSTIERSFNEIWGVQRSRSLLRKLSDYLAMVVITPIFLFVATGLTTAAQNNGVEEFLRDKLGLGSFIDLFLRCLPLFALWIAFTFVYLAMPNAKTRFSSAVLGALIGGTLWQVTLILHLKFQIGIARYNAIYSSFAAIPIFLMWINLSWVAVLLGAEVCFAHQSEESYLSIGESATADHAFKEIVALRAMTRIGAAFLHGRPAWTVARLAQDLGLPLRPLEEVALALVDQKILVEAIDGQDQVLLPARDLDSITVKGVLDALKGTRGLVDVPVKAVVDEHIDRLLAGIDQEMEGSRWNPTLKSLAEETGSESGMLKREAIPRRKEEARERTG